MRVRLRSSGVVALAAVLLALVLTGCEPRTLSITTTPALFPRFSTAVPDYVSRCDDSAPVEVSVSAPSGTTVTVEGTPPGSGTFTRSVTRDVGQDFTIVVQSGSGTTTHHVRCLPGDFPGFTAQRTGRTQSEFYVTTPQSFLGGSSYPVVFDANGVPVWWGPKTAAFFALPLPNGHIAWNINRAGRIDEYTFDGQFVRSYSTVNEPFDFHDLVVLPNGNHLAVSITPKSGVDLSSWGGPANATVVDHIIQEVTPLGLVLWSWVTSDHIPVTETTQHWRDAELNDPGGPFTNFYDPWHYNSIEPAADGDVIVSYRHLDAVVRIDRLTGAVVWKLGGTTTPASLEISGDPEFAPGGGGGFGGQHDARFVDGDTVSIYDNGTGRNRPPRGVVYDIDEAAGTAALVQRVRDPLEVNAFCCGSFRRLPGQNVVFGWGGNNTDGPDITEATRNGSRLFELSFLGGAFVYRGLPVLPGVFSRTTLRSGMDAQFG
jgi:arylsulfotransferase ASST